MPLLVEELREEEWLSNPSPIPVTGSTLKKDDATESSSCPPPMALALMEGQLAELLNAVTECEETRAPPSDLGLLSRGFILGPADGLVRGMTSFLGASLRLDPVKLLALRRSLTLTLYLRHIQRRESSGSTQWCAC